MAAYFLLAVSVYPQIYQSEANVPKPTIDISVSSDTIYLGQSFDIAIRSYNEGDVADLQIVSVGFPQNKNLDGIRITSYDFPQSPRMILPGNDVGANYTGGQITAKSQYPMIEAYSRPSKPDDVFQMKLQITPAEIGSFHVYAKTVAMPHSDDTSHFPAFGLTDHQNEFVLDYVVHVMAP